jgi:transcriptional regulator with XRE-family HTH domain
MPTTITGVDVQRLRQKTGWSQKDVADLLRVNVATICRWESNEDPSAIGGTAKLVLIPLMMANGIEVVRTESPLAERAVEWLRKTGMLRQGVDDSEVAKAMSSQMLLDGDLIAARNLFYALKKAWDQIESRTAQPGPYQVPAPDVQTDDEKHRVTRLLRRGSKRAEGPTA